MTDAQLYVAISGLLAAVVAFFLVRLVRKVDVIHEWIIGKPGSPGIDRRVASLEEWRQSVWRDRDAPIRRRSLAPRDVGTLEPERP